jgi:LDH2 family malate/lactate/ureidoglycolate dehydrogenase
MRMAIDRAEQHGIGSVTMSNAGHLGPCAYTAMMPLEHDMIGLSMTTGGVGMVPTFGAKPMIGINPLGFAAPAASEPPFVFDAAMAAVAGNKVELARRLGAELSPGWVAGPDGTPIMESGPVPDEFSFLPLGATRELGSHKGYSLALMIDVLTGVLSGNGPGFRNNMVFSHYFCAIKIEAFTDPDKFKQDMDDYMRALVETPTAPDHERVVYAGLPEHETELDRRANGIPLHPEVADWFAGITSELGVKNGVREAAGE